MIWDNYKITWEIYKNVRSYKKEIKRVEIMIDLDKKHPGILQIYQF